MCIITFFSELTLRLNQKQICFRTLQNWLYYRFVKMQTTVVLYIVTTAFTKKLLPSDSAVFQPISIAQQSREIFLFRSEPSLWNETFISATYFFMHVTFWKTGSSPTVRVSATKCICIPPTTPQSSQSILDDITSQGCPRYSAYRHGDCNGGR